MTEKQSIALFALIVQFLVDEELLPKGNTHQAAIAFVIQLIEQWLIQLKKIHMEISS